MVRCLAFDIETVPDVEFGRRLYGVDGLSDEDVARIMFARCRQDRGSEFLPIEQHRVVAISVALRVNDAFKLWSLGERNAGESEIIERFFDGLERYQPDLVSWNGGGFDLPVLHYRALRHRLSCARYWEVGEEDKSFRYNNYLARFHWRHIDLMDVLSGYQPRARASLENIAQLLGLPGKLGMAGDQVWDSFLAGDVQGIRDYCETDVLNTYLIYLRFELMRGRLDQAGYETECGYVRDTLKRASQPHLDRFLEAWDEVR